MTGRRRRRSKPLLGAQLRRFWLLGLVALTVLGAATGWLVTMPALKLHRLTVSSLAHVSREEIVARAAIDPHANIWLMNRGAVQRRLEAIPYVLRARVHRHVPGEIWLDVTERVADGCVRDAVAQTYTVDASLRVLEYGCTATGGVRFVVRGVLAAEAGSTLRDPELLTLQRDARALAAAGDRYRSFAHDPFGELVATLARGIDVRFGDDDDLTRKRRLIGPILAQLGPRATDVRAVDLRAAATPVVEYRR